MSDLVPSTQSLFSSDGELILTESSPDVLNYLSTTTDSVLNDHYYGAHRNTSCNSEYFRWQVLGDGRNAIPELVQGIHNFVAIRGMPIEFSFGFSLYDSEERKQICRTTSFEVVVDGEVKTRSGSTPLPFPVFQPFQSKAKPNVLNIALQRSRGVLYGSRYTDDGTLMTCRSCVESGKYLHKDYTCSMNGNLLFCVFQLGKLEFDRNQGRVYVEWVNVEDAGIDTIDSPFILRINRLNKTLMFNKFGLDENDLKILTSDMDKSSYVPSDVLSPGDYFKAIHSVPERCLRLATGQAAYLYPTELYIARVNPKAGLPPSLIAYPAFRIITDPEILKYSKQLLDTAWRVYHQERAIYDGAVVPNVKLFTFKEIKLETSQLPDDFAPASEFTFVSRRKR